MKHLTEHLWMEVPARRGLVNLTDAVARLVTRSGVQEGLCLVNAMHITPCVAYLSCSRKMGRSRGLG
ncbi:MAG TPA: YjbQ family protein [Verrucomicrobiota bacterium]|nr:YjbQ family protein [Verrucomicrobiota bacterium]